MDYLILLLQVVVGVALFLQVAYLLHLIIYVNLYSFLTDQLYNLNKEERSIYILWVNYVKEMEGIRGDDPLIFFNGLIVYKSSKGIPLYKIKRTKKSLNFKKFSLNSHLIKKRATYHYKNSISQNASKYISV